jgi:hypothetical protein
VIPAPRGYRASYKREAPRHHDYRDVIAFDEDGVALVVGERGSLVPATSYSGFDEILDPGYTDNIWGYVEHVVPGGGWMERYVWETKEGQKVYADQPVVAWVVTHGGMMVPLGTDSEGMVDKLSSDTLVWHPDSTGTPPVPVGTVPADPPTEG